MDKKNLIYIALGALIMLPSCSQEEPAASQPARDSNRIYFRSYLPTVTESRALTLTTDNFNTCQVTCFSPEDTDYITEDGDITPYFPDTRFDKDPDGLFYSRGGDACNWPDAETRLHFYAYSPSVESMKQVSGDSYFNLVNSSRTGDDGKGVIDYRLKKFRVAEDIADQVDFITAYAPGSLTENVNTGIALDFKHQLARVEISAWGDNSKYDYEIAGVRIGNPYVEGDFNLSALPVNSTPAWENVDTQAPVQHIFMPGESVVYINNDSGLHTTEAEAASIMGAAGPAMVIPMSERIEAWEGKSDPAINASPYVTDRLYFSVLLRVKNKSGEIAYPYHNDRDGMKVIYLAVDAEGTVVEHLYKFGSDYYTVDKQDEEYLFTPADGVEIHAYGWAALPLAAKWEVGKIYTYRLNYSNGIGWHDPSDPDPGEPIIERGKIPFDVTVSDWVPADENDYTPGIVVPKR